MSERSQNWEYVLNLVLQKKKKKKESRNIKKYIKK